MTRLAALLEDRRDVFAEGHGPVCVLIAGDFGGLSTKN
jgi:hypothetical protein